jgi:hypothetical protein
LGFISLDPGAIKHGYKNKKEEQHVKNDAYGI